MDEMTIPTPVQSTNAQRQVSVVIPLYNKIKYIGRAIDSVLAQTYPYFELIVVDDGSTDGSGDAARRYDDVRVRTIAQENGGEGAARNRGVAEARFDWIALLDADDEWMPRFLERAMAAATANPAADAIFTDLRNGADGSLWIGDPRGGPVADFLRFYTDHGGYGMTPCSSVISKAAILKAGGFPLGVRYGGDVDTWTRLALTDHKFHYVSEPLAIYHGEAEGSVMKDGARKVLDAPLVSIRTCRRWREEGKIPPHLLDGAERMVNFMHLRYARHLIAVCEKRQARKVLRENCIPRLCGRSRFWRTYLRTFTPEVLMPIRRFIHNMFRTLTSGN
jgi:glycosyltransferase involved in cell wall biosynthesis